MEQPVVYASYYLQIWHQFCQARDQAHFMPLSLVYIIEYWNVIFAWNLIVFYTRKKIPQTNCSISKTLPLPLPVVFGPTRTA